MWGMTLHLEIEPGVPVPDKDDVKGQQELLVTARAAAKAAEMLSEHGLDLDLEDEDCQTAAALATQYAKDPMATSAAATPPRLAQTTPAALMLTSHILNEFGHAIVKDSVQVRHMVTNKLVQETENPDPRIRLKALELLGKITDVGLFSEKSEVTVTHQTADDLRSKLREKLTMLKNVTPDEITDADVIDG